MSNDMDRIQINFRARVKHKKKLERWANASNTTTSAIILKLIENLPEDAIVLEVPARLG